MHNLCKECAGQALTLINDAVFNKKIVGSTKSQTLGDFLLSSNTCQKCQKNNKKSKKKCLKNLYCNYY